MTKENEDKTFARLAPASAIAPENLTHAATTEAASDYDKPLDVTIERDALVIRIGIGVLAHAVTCADWANPYDEDAQDYIRTFAIEDAKEFARDVRAAMRYEDEVGASLLTNFIDKASETAVNEGALGVHPDEQKIKHGEKSPLETW
jgi:hypothetical protein